jgi:hypothetical protein
MRLLLLLGPKSLALFVYQWFSTFPTLKQTKFEGTPKNWKAHPKQRKLEKDERKI